MATIRRTWNELVKQTRAAMPKLATVRAVPLNRMANAAFLKDFPGIKLPAGMIVFLGRSTEMRGAARNREMRWSAVFAFSDPDGKAYAGAVDQVDAFEDRMLDRQLLGAELTIHGSCEVGVAFTNPRFGIYEVAFTTREVAER